MSQRVYDSQNGATPRNLVEVPMPLNGKPRQSRSQFPFDDAYNNNSNAFNSNSFRQQNDEYSLAPRAGSKNKTIIIKDEKGNEISRIVSSNSRNRDRPPLIDNNSLVPVRNNFVAPYPPPPQQYVAPPNNVMNGLVLQPQQYVYQPQSAVPTPVPMIVQPMNSAPIMVQTIPEESSNSKIDRKRRTSAQYRTLEKARDLRTAKERDQEFKDLRRKLDDNQSILSDDRLSGTQRLKMVDRKDHIFCCAFCERANTDTCQFCWRLCGFPTWFSVLIGAIFLLIIIALAVVLGLMAGNVITVG